DGAGAAERSGPVLHLRRQPAGRRIWRGEEQRRQHAQGNAELVRLSDPWSGPSGTVLQGLVLPDGLLPAPAPEMGPALGASFSAGTTTMLDAKTQPHAHLRTPDWYKSAT